MGYFIFSASLTQILNCLPDASPLVYFEYTYDEAGRISKCRRENGTTIYYTYSPNSRLTSETWQSSDMSTIYAFSWDYDKLGNRTSSQENSSLTYYYYGEGNTLIREEPIGEDLIYYEYDNRGNCTTIKQGTSTTYFEYNPNNLVRSIHYPNGTLNYFHYDSSLRRYALEDSNGLRYFTWDSNGTDLLAERNLEGEVVANYTHGYTPIDGIGSMVAAEKTVGTVTYYQYPIYDHRGTVMRIVDEDGEVCGDFEYSAWGKPLHEEVNGAETRFRYQSNWICLDDSEGEFVLSPTRLYHSGLGRFLSRDLLGHTDNLNLYEAFAGNSSLYSDPLGLEIYRNVYERLKLARKLIGRKFKNFPRFKQTEDMWHKIRKQIFVFVKKRQRKNYQNLFNIALKVGMLEAMEMIDKSSLSFDAAEEGKCLHSESCLKRFFNESTSIDCASTVTLIHRYVLWRIFGKRTLVGPRLGREWLDVRYIKTKKWDPMNWKWKYRFKGVRRKQFVWHKIVGFGRISPEGKMRVRGILRSFDTVLLTKENNAIEFGIYIKKSLILAPGSKGLFTIMTIKELAKEGYRKIEIQRLDPFKIGANPKHYR